MRLSVRHETAYTYTAEVRSSYNELRLLPAATPTQRVISAAVRTAPTGLQREYVDYFGNRVMYLEIGQAHTRLRITAEMVVETLAAEAGEREPWAGPGYEPAGAGEFGGGWRDEQQRLRPATEFLLAGALTRPDAATERALRGLPGDDPWGLMEAVASRLRYEKGVTDTATDVNAALAGGAGVCQDYTHVFVAACRLHGLPARYVGGYFLPDGPHSTHYSHAWAEVFHGGAWRGLDPTNRRATTERYLSVAFGRDYADVPPIKGVFLGAGTQGMRVRLRVRSEDGDEGVDEPAAPAAVPEAEAAQ